MNRTGLSEIITSILFILIILIAIGIIWAFVRPFVTETSQTQSASDCLLVQVQPIKCIYSGFDRNWYVTTQVQRGPENANLSGLRIELHNQTANPSALLRDWNQRTLGGSIPRAYESSNAVFSIGDFVPTSIAIAGTTGSDNHVCSLSSPLVCTRYQYIPGSGCSDFDGSAFTDYTDFDLFVQCYEGEPLGIPCAGGTRTADITGDGFIAPEDFNAFVEAFERGDTNCP